MRIVIPIHSFEPGGVERTALHLAQAWYDAGHHVTIVLGRTQGAMPVSMTGPNMVVKQTKWPTAPVETLWMMVGLFRYLRTNRADILFCPGNSYAIVVGVMRLLLGGACPPIVSKISNDLRRRDMVWPVR